MKNPFLIVFFLLGMSVLAKAADAGGLDKHLEEDFISAVLMRVGGISQIYNHGGGRSQDGRMVTRRIHFSAQIDSSDYPAVRDEIFAKMIEDIEERGFQIGGQGTRSRPASGTFRYSWERGAGTVSVIIFLPNDPEDRRGQIFFQDDDAKGVFIPEVGSPQITFFITEFEFGSESVR